MNRKQLSNSINSFRNRRTELWNITIDEMDTIVLTISETLEYDWRNRISLFQFRGKWGFCMHVWPGDEAGEFYGPRFSFCDPYPDRMAAIAAAVDKMLNIYKKSRRKEAKYMIIWAKSLLEPKQLRMDI